MGIFKPGALVGGISGKVGGATFVNTSGSSVIRMSKRHGKYPSNAQLQESTNLQRAIIRWKNLSVDNKKLWNVAALTKTFSNRLGEQMILTGYQYFLKAQAYQDVDTPPNQSTVSPEAILNFKSSIADGLELFCDLGAGGTLIQGVIQGMPLYRSTPIKFQGFHREIFDFSFSFSFGVNFDTVWQTLFPAPVLGQYIALRWVYRINFVYTGQIHSQIVETTAT